MTKEEFRLGFYRIHSDFIAQALEFTRCDNIYRCCKFKNEFLEKCKNNGIDIKTICTDWLEFTHLKLRISLLTINKCNNLDFYSETSGDEYMKIISLCKELDERILYANARDSLPLTPEKLTGIDNGSVLYENEFLSVILNNPNYPFIKMNKSGAILVPYDKDGNIYFIEKDRPNIGKYYELPRGFIENGEDVKVGALRELLEETGMTTDLIELLGYIQPDSGIMNNPVPVYQVLVKAKDDYIHYDDADEDNCKILRRDMYHVDKYIDEGKIVCGFTQSALMKKICKDNLLTNHKGERVGTGKTSFFTR